MDRIMIVDSVAISAELMAKQLKNSGYDVICVTQMKGLMINLKISKPDILILDIDIGNESGFDFCKKIKNDDETKYISVLIMGSSDSSNSLKRAFESGADDYMSKASAALILPLKVRSLLRIKYLGDELKNKYIEIEEKNNILNLQMQMARQVQRSLINEINIKYNGISIVSKYIPAMEIGGDFYDIIELNDNLIAVVMGDVSGHGISAALLTAMLNMMIKNLAVKYREPDLFLHNMNNEFYKIFVGGNISIYASLFCAIFDTKDKKIYYSNAGQVLPMLVDSKNKKVAELDAYGMPIGMIEGTTYECKTADYSDNDLILFYTDGLADNLYKDNSDEFFKRIKTMLIDMSDDVAPDVMINSLLNVFYKFDATDNMRYEFDDVSIIMCKM